MQRKYQGKTTTWLRMHLYANQKKKKEQLPADTSSNTRLSD